MPQAAVDPVVMAAMIVVRLQTIVSRELAATTPAVVTAGSIHAGTGPNVIPDSAVIDGHASQYAKKPPCRGPLRERPPMALRRWGLVRCPHEPSRNTLVLWTTAQRADLPVGDRRPVGRVVGAVTAAQSSEVINGEPRPSDRLRPVRPEPDGGD